MPLLKINNIEYESSSYRENINLYKQEKAEKVIEFFIIGDAHAYEDEIIQNNFDEANHVILFQNKFSSKNIELPSSAFFYIDDGNNSICFKYYVEG